MRKAVQIMKQKIIILKSDKSKCIHATYENINNTKIYVPIWQTGKLELAQMCKQTWLAV